MERLLSDYISLALTPVSNIQHCAWITHLTNLTRFNYLPVATNRSCFESFLSLLYPVHWKKPDISVCTEIVLLPSEPLISYILGHIVMFSHPASSKEHFADEHSCHLQKTTGVGFPSLTHSNVMLSWTTYKGAPLGTIRRTIGGARTRQQLAECNC